MQIKVRTDQGTWLTRCYTLFYVHFNAVPVMFAITDAISADRLEVTEYGTGMRFPVELLEPSGDTLGLDSPMRDDDPYRVDLVARAERLIREMMCERELTSVRLLELIQINQRKYQTNILDF